MELSYVPIKSCCITEVSRHSIAKRFRGKTVGYSGTPLSEMYLKTMVKEAGGNPDTVKVVDVGFDLVPALITKKWMR